MTIKTATAGITVAVALGSALLLSPDAAPYTPSTLESAATETATRNGRTGDFENLRQYLDAQGKRHGITFRVVVRPTLTRRQADQIAAGIGSADAIIALSYAGRRGYVYLGTDLAAALPPDFATTLETTIVNPNMARKDWYNAIQEAADSIVDTFYLTSV